MNIKNSSKTNAAGSQSEETKSGILDSDFIPLDDLVYAPLHALARSNIQLRGSVVDAVKSLGTVKQDGQEEVIHLNHVNIAYDHIKPNTDDGYNVENLQLQIPMLSIVPITNLNVEKAEIDFSTEIRAVKEGDDRFKITGRICSPEQRESDFLPKVSYKMQVTSVAATEGLMRLTDLLSTNQVAKQLDATPVTTDGNLRTEEEKEYWQSNNDTKIKVKKLQQLYHRIADMMEEQEKLQQISKLSEQEDSYQYNKDKYLKIQANIANEIMKLKETIMDYEIQLSKGNANG